MARGGANDRDYFLTLAVVFLGYFVAGKLGLQVPFTNLNVSPVWPPAGFALAAILLWGIRVWPAIALAAFCVNFFSEIPHAAAFGIAVGNTSGALLSGWLVGRVRGFDRALRRLSDASVRTASVYAGPARRICLARRKQCV